jgi:ankyrin repeat protein
MALPIPPSLPAPEFKLDTPTAYFDDAPTQALLSAALAGDLAKARQAVQRGASPDAEGPKSNPYNHLRLLHYAIAANSVPGIQTLIAVGANPEIGTQGSASLPLLFAVNLDKPELLSLMLDLRPVDKLSADTKELLMFRSVTLGRPKCLAVLIKHGVPIDYPDEAGATVLMRAIDAQDYDVAAWLMEQGASVTFVAHDRTIAWSVEFHLAKYTPGSPPYQKVLALKQMAEQRGAQFPAKSPKQRREERKAASGG